VPSPQRFTLVEAAAAEGYTNAISKAATVATNLNMLTQGAYLDAGIPQTENGGGQKFRFLIDG